MLDETGREEDDEERHKAEQPTPLLGHTNIGVRTVPSDIDKIQCNEFEEPESGEYRHQHLDSHKETSAVEHEVGESVLIGMGQIEDVDKHRLDEHHGQIGTNKICHEDGNHLRHTILEVETHLGVRAAPASKEEDDKRHDAQQRIEVVPQHIGRL